MKKYIFDKPPSLNQLLNSARTNRFKSASVKKRWTLKAKKSVIDQGLVRYTQPVWLFVTISYSTATTDVDNSIAVLKPILDGMVAAGVLEDDSIKYITPQLYITMVKKPRKEQFVSVEIFINKGSYKNKVVKDLTNGNN